MKPLAFGRQPVRFLLLRLVHKCPGNLVQSARWMVGMQCREAQLALPRFRDDTILVIEKPAGKLAWEDNRHRNERGTAVKVDAESRQWVCVSSVDKYVGHHFPHADHVHVCSLSLHFTIS